jgi:hypothetical protein
VAGGLRAPHRRRWRVRASGATAGAAVGIVIAVADQSPGSANRFRLLRAPWWLLSLYVGVPFGLLLWGVAATTGAAGSTSAITAVLGGVLAGLVGGPLLARAHPEADAVPEDQRRAVRRAAAGGPVPADPAVRAAAAALAARQLAAAVRYRWPVAVVLGLLTLLESAAALAYTPWLWVGAALFLAILALQLRQPARLRRRIDELAP